MKMNLIIAILTSVALISSAHAVETSFEADASLPLVNLDVVVKGGSVNDPVGQSGISSFAAEMLLRGTRLRNKEQLNEALDQIGATLGVEVRAEAVIFHGAVVSDQLVPFLGLLEEVITQPAFGDDEIRKLKNESISNILNELGSDQSLASRFFQKQLFGKHPYGSPVNGTKKDVERFTKKQILAQYDLLFQANRMIVIGSGLADQKAISDFSDRLETKRPGSGTQSRLTTPVFSGQKRLQIVDKPDRTQTQIYIGLPGVKMNDSHFFGLHLANIVFGGGSFQARLMSEVRAKRGWAYGAYSNYRFGTQPRSWTAYTFPATKDTAPAIGLVLKMMDDFKTKGVTPEEFEFNKTSQLKSIPFSYNTPRKRIDNAILERTLDLPTGYMKSFGPEIEKLTLADVNAAAASFYDTSKVAITVLGTSAKIKDDVAAAAGMKPEQAQVIDYRNE